VKVKVLIEDVEHQVKEEATEMFLNAKKFLGQSRLIELGAERAVRKQQLEKHLKTEPAFGNQAGGRNGKMTIKIKR